MLLVQFYTVTCVHKKKYYLSFIGYNDGLHEQIDDNNYSHL